MSRLYLIIVFIGISTGFSQDLLKKYLDFAKEQYNKGDYYYALEYYEKAMKLDSQTIDIVWQYAETLRAYKDYRKAEYYYAQVYDREAAQIYPYSLLYLGLMQKQNGKYDAALTTFKKAKKKYYKDKKGYLYKKSKQEIESVLWAQSAYLDTTDLNVELLPGTVNTKNSEFGHGIYKDQLYFSSLRADSVSAAEEVYSTSYHTQLYTSTIEDNQFKQSEKMEDLILKEMSTGNGTYSLDGRRFYFSRCVDDGYNYRCKIWVANLSNGQWIYVDSLGEIINEPGTNTTMPCIANMNGSEVLFFSSNREDSEGGMDIYYSEIRDGNQFGKVRSLKTINSLDNEVTPWWDSINQRLYFASSWHNGFGGYDVFYTQYTTRFEPPVNVGLPVNSSANDLYYFKQADTIYVTSNRIGVNYSKNPTCCSDIFVMKPPLIYVPPTAEETLFDLNKRLPVTLYFHNDIPNPRSWDTTSNVNYIDSYNDYTAMLEKYQKEYSDGLKGDRSDEAKEDIETFFIEYVDKGVSDLELFRDLLLKELDKGAKIQITVKGFASPLAKTDYNVNLTKRRIRSLINYLREYNGGVFAEYLDNTAENGGRVVFQQVPFGEYTANQLTSDNPNDTKNSVYSRAAAIERKIEIQSVSYFTEESEFPLRALTPVVNGGVVKRGTLVKGEFVLTNTSDKEIVIEWLDIPCDCTEAEVSKSTLAPGESTKIEMILDTSELNGFLVKSIHVKVAGIDEKLRLYLSTEVKN